MPERRFYLVPDGLPGDRIDPILSRMTDLSRSVCAAAVQKDGVWIDGTVTSRFNQAPSGAALETLVPDPPSLEPRPSAEEIVRLYEDEGVVAADGPAGMAAHPSLDFEGPDVLGTLMAEGAKLTTHGPQEKKGTVHRLDVGTTDCMVVAKSEAVYSALKCIFRDRAVKKVHHALVQGHPDPMSGTIEAPIGRDNRCQWKTAVRADGRPSVTHYEALEAMTGASLLEVRPETGRTYQIRVHMLATSHPCVGGDIYGADPTFSARFGLTRQWLHAVRLRFGHPTSGEWVAFTALYPEDLQNSLEAVHEGVFR